VIDAVKDERSVLIHKADDVPAPRIIRPNEMTGTCVQGSILVLLSRELEGVYRSLEKGTGTLARWRLAREATKLRTRHAFVLELAVILILVIELGTYSTAKSDTSDIVCYPNDCETSRGES